VPSLGFDVAGFHRFGQAGAKIQRCNALAWGRYIVFSTLDSFDRRIGDISEINNFSGHGKTVSGDFAVFENTPDS
jgi:hypothetical protein